MDPTFDPEDGLYHVAYDWGSVKATGIVVVEAVARVLHTDPLDLRPLQEVVDVDSVDALLTSANTAPLTVEFEYAGAIVRLSRSGNVVIDPQ